MEGSPDGFAKKSKAKARRILTRTARVSAMDKRDRTVIKTLIFCYFSSFGHVLLALGRQVLGSEKKVPLCVSTNTTELSCLFRREHKSLQLFWIKLDATGTRRSDVGFGCSLALSCRRWFATCRRCCWRCTSISSMTLPTGWLSTSAGSR